MLLLKLVILFYSASGADTDTYIHNDDHSLAYTTYTVLTDSQSQCNSQSTCQEFCEEIGANLVEIHTSEEMDMLRNWLLSSPHKNEEFWVGLKRNADDNLFTWSSSGVVLREDHEFWADTPGSNDVCVMLRKSGNTLHLDGADDCIKQDMYGLCEGNYGTGTLS